MISSYVSNKLQNVLKNGNSCTSYAPEIAFNKCTHGGMKYSLINLRASINKEKHRAEKDELCYREKMK